MKKRLIMIGAGCWFADSFIYFIEKGFDVIVIRAKHKLIWFEQNYAIYEKMGAKVIDYDNDNLKKIFRDLNLDENTLILGGGNFAGNLKSFDIFYDLSIEELNLLYEISKYNYLNSCGAKVIRFFNGDTGFGSEKIIDMFNQKIEYVDTLLFDNDLLKEFVLSNIPNARNKKCLLGWIETPLKRFIKLNQNPEISKSYISLGRVICSSNFNLKSHILWYPKPYKNYSGIKRVQKKIYYKYFKHLQNVYSLAGQNSLEKIYLDRKKFFETNSHIAFGLSHFYDIFDNSVDLFTRNKKFCFSTDGQHFTNNAFSVKEAYYAFCNNPSKDIGYLMNGIIPLISHDLHNVYKSMVDNKMAILIKTKDDIEKVLHMKDSEIRTYRENIYKHSEIFTFETAADLLIKEL